jgi:chromosome segregation ATPase
VKSLIIRLLNLLGLVPARRYRFLAGQLKDAERRTKKLAKQIKGLEASSNAWKSKTAEATKHLKMKEQELARHLEGQAKLQGSADKMQQREVQLESMQARLIEAQRDLATAREHLMAIEVKLDILEGAANVLDVRTRAALVRQPGETGAPV